MLRQTDGVRFIDRATHSMRAVPIIEILRFGVFAIYRRVPGAHEI